MIDIPEPLTPEQREALCALVFDTWTEGYDYGYAKGYEAASNEPAAVIASEEFRVDPVKWRKAVRKAVRRSEKGLGL